MPSQGELIPRQLTALVAEALLDTRVVAINGARQVGKSTLARLTATAHPGTVIRLLDDPATRQAAHDDPVDFVEHNGLMVIDEAQLAPDLFRAIKVAVDTNPHPGQFLLTGSSQILALRQLPDALPGRMEIVELWPLSQGEIDRTPDRFVDAAFRNGPALAHTSELRRRDYLDRAVRGGYPEAIRRTARRRAAFFESYLTTLIERDVTALSVIERRGELRRLLALLAGRSGNLLVPNALATQSGIPRTTLTRYLELLSAVFLVKSIPAWSSGQTRRAVGAAKLAFVDSGLACHLLGQDPVRLAEPGGAAGPMLETFVLMELARQLTWSDERVRLYHYRTKDNVEVDAVLESADGRIVAIEVKASSTIRTEDLAGLRHLASRTASCRRIRHVHRQQTLPFGTGSSSPTDTLWNA
jgi:predicted AAA+ superfamily ATPase